MQTFDDKVLQRAVVIVLGPLHEAAMMTVGAGRPADGVARCSEREVVVSCSQPRPGKAEGERAGDGL